MGLLDRLKNNRPDDDGAGERTPTNFDELQAEGRPISGIPFLVEVNSRSVWARFRMTSTSVVVFGASRIGAPSTGGTAGS